MARELTKLHEEVRRGPLAALAAYYSEAGEPRGEIVIVVGAAEAREAVGDDALDADIRAALAAALSVKDAAAAVAAKHGLPRRQVYARALALAGAQR